MAKLYKTDGSVVDVNPKNARKGFQLQELYDLIKCDCVDIKNYVKGKCFVCDDEGLLKPNPVCNEAANLVILNETGDYWGLVGNVLICADSDVK